MIYSNSSFIDEIDKKKTKPLSKDEEIFYFKKLELKDSNAKNILFMRNLRLVSSIAKKYGRYRSNYEDIIHAGCEGLIKAINRFNYKKGTKFSTYATPYINGYICNYLYRDNANFKKIYIPKNELDIIDSTYEELYIKNKRKPSYKELNEKLSMIDNSKLYQYIINKELNDQILDINVIVIKDDNNIEEYVINKKCDYEFYDFVMNSNLTDKEKSIISMKYGLNNTKEYTLDELASIYNCSKQNIVNYINSILFKLRSNANMKSYAIRLDNEDEAIRNLDRLIHDYLNKKDNFNNKRKKESNKSLYNTLKKYSKEEIDIAISKLYDEDRRLLQIRYGENYDELISSNDIDKKTLTKINGTILSRLKNHLNGKFDNALFKLFKGYSIEEVRQIIDDLKEEDIRMLKEHYGENYDEYIPAEYLDKDDIYKMSTLLIPKMKRKLKKCFR